MSFIGFLLGNLLNIANPFLLKEFINWIEDDDPKTSTGYILFALFTIVALIKPFLHAHAMKAGHNTLISMYIVIFGLY